MESMNLIDIKYNSEERAGSVKEIIKDRPLKDLIYPSAVITVKKVLKE